MKTLELFAYISTEKLGKTLDNHSIVIYCTFIDYNGTSPLPVVFPSRIFCIKSRAFFTFIVKLLLDYYGRDRVYDL